MRKGLFSRLKGKDGSGSPSRQASPGFGDDATPFGDGLTQSILQAAGEGIFGIDLDGRCLFCNPRALKLLGFDASEDLSGRNIHELIHGTTLDGCACGPVECRVLGAIREGAGKVLPDEVFQRSDDTLFPVECRTHPIIQDGRIVGGVVCFIDVSEMRKADAALTESEERFRGIFEQSAVGMAIFGPDGRYVKANDALCRILGYAEAELIQLTYLDLTHPDDRVESAERMEKIRAGELGHYEVEKRYLRKDGKTIWVWVSSSTIRDAAGTPVLNLRQIQDISARKEAENAARENEARFRAVVEYASAAIVLKSPGGEFLLSNDVQEKWYGMSTKEAPGKTVFDLFPPEIAADLAQQDTRVRETGEAANFEAELPFADGSLHTVLITKFPVHLPDGTLLAIGSFSIDITDLKLADEAVRRSEQRLRAAVDSLHEGFALFDSEDRAVIVNDAYRRLNPAAEEAVQKGWTFEELLRVNVSRGVLSDADGCEEGFIRDRLEQHRRADTSTVRRFAGDQYFLIKESRTADDGTALAFIDITDQKRVEQALRESEEQFREVIDNSTATISLRDGDGRFLLLNRAFARHHGVTQEDAKGKHPRDLFDADTEAAVSLNDDVVISGREPISFEHVYRDRDGNQRSALTNKFPILDEIQRVAGIGAISTDITEYKHLEERLHHGQKLEAIGQLTGGVAHDFNNILAVILTDLEFLEELTEGDQTQREILAEAIRAVHRGANLTGRLLAFSRKQQLRPEGLDLIAVISDMVDMLSRTLGEVISIHTEFAGDLRHVFLDRGQFENALLNLAVNARDAMPNGGQLEIRATNREILRRKQGRINEIPPGWYVCVEIRDTGEGMSEEILARAFEPFFTTKGRGQGSGLGLSMVYGFVAQSGGTISVDSDTGKGTAIKIMFPAIVEERHAGDRNADAPAEAPSPDCPGGSETILVVEDDSDVAASACRTLEGLGYRVLMASDALQALACIRHEGEGIDLLFSDVVMPGGMNGRELAEEARKIVPGIRICLTSGYSNGTLDAEEAEANGILFLPKPYRRRPLAEMVRRLLDGDSVGERTISE